MKRLRDFSALLPIALIAVTLIGCEKKPATTTTTTPAKTDDAKGPIKIGAYLSLTGPQATFGTTSEKGMKLAVKEKNAAGGVLGRPIELIVYDNQGKTGETGSVVTRLVASDKVVAVLGEVASSQSLAAGPICQQYGVPMISPSSTNPKVTEVGDMIFRVCFIDPDQGYAGAKFAVEHLKAKKAAILYDQKQPYSTGLAENFRGWFTKLGGEVVTDQAYSSGTTDYSAQLNAIKELAPDVIYVPGYYDAVGTIARQARSRGVTAPMLGGDGWESPELTKLAGGALEGSYYSNHYAPEVPRPESEAYIAAYKEEFKETPGALSALGYDSAMVLFAAMERSPSLKGKDLAKAISETKGHKGVTGTITLDAKRNATKPMVMLRIEGDKDVFVTSIDPPGEAAGK